MWELDHKEAWVQNNWYFWIMLLEKIFRSSLESKGCQHCDPKYPPSIFIGKTEAEIDAPILGTPDANRLFGKDPALGKIEDRRRKGQERMRWLHSTMIWTKSRRWWRKGESGMLPSMWLQSWTQFSKWRTALWLIQWDNP